MLFSYSLNQEEKKCFVTVKIILQCTKRVLNIICITYFVPAGTFFHRDKFCGCAGLIISLRCRACSESKIGCCRPHRRPSRPGDRAYGDNNTVVEIDWHDVKDETGDGCYMRAKRKNIYIYISGPKGFLSFRRDGNGLTKTGGHGVRCTVSYNFYPLNEDKSFAYTPYRRTVYAPTSFHADLHVSDASSWTLRSPKWKTNKSVNREK